MTPHDLDDGADLRALIDRSISAVEAPHGVGPAATARGRRLRARRRTARGAAGLLAATAVALAVAPALGGSQQSIAIDPGASRSSDTTTTPTPTPTPDAGIPPRWWDVPSTDLADTLTSLLPPGVTVTSVTTTLEGKAPGQTYPAFGSLSGVLATSEGEGSFQLLLYAPEVAPEDVPAATTTTDAAGNEHTTAYATAATTYAERTACEASYDTCSPIRGAAGAVVGRVMTDTEDGTLLYEAFLLGPDGGALNFTVMNSTGDKPGYAAPSAPAPPLTPTQLVALVRAPAWTT